MTEYSSDIAIFGGGIAGLWAFHTLERLGYRPVLIERHALGSGQTLASQGILHGGMKYALDGKVDEIALRLRDMPGKWLEALTGRGEIDLSMAKILSDHQVMWSDGSLLSRISGALGTKMLKGAVDALPEEKWPEVFRQNNYRGTVRALQETVLEIKSVVSAMAAPLAGRIFRAQGIDLLVADGKLEGAKLYASNHAPCILRSRLYVFTAGTGNESPAQQLPVAQPATQRRPLKQVLVRSAPGQLFGHCIVADPKPRVTVTTHTLDTGEMVWYLGGNVAEKATHLSDAEALAFAAREMAAIFPKVNWQEKFWAVWPVDRAEPHQSVRFMPAEPTVVAAGNCLIAWPTKLVFAPGLAAKLAQEVATRLPAGDLPPPQLPLPPAQVGRYPWELAEWTKIS